MRFAKIAITKKGVHLTRETKDQNGAIESIDLESPERPLASFADALQGFKSYVRDLMPFELSDDQLTVTTLNLSEDKNGHRGLIVTAIVPVPKAYDKPVVLNTPLVREGGENPSDDAFVLNDDVMALIALAEEEATRYAKGERVQGELFSREEREAEPEPMSENEAAVNDRMAAAEVASTRKPGRNGAHPENGTKTGMNGRTNTKPARAPRRKKGADFIPGVGNVVNADATDAPTDGTLRDLLLRAGRDVPLDAIGQWTSIERDAAQRWADSRVDPTRDAVEEPGCVKIDSARTLEDGWTDANPPRVDDDGAQAIAAAKEAGD